MHANHPRVCSVTALLALLGLSACGDKTVKHVLKGSFNIPAEEVAAIKELVESSSFKPDQVKAYEGFARCYSCAHVLIRQGHVHHVRLENIGVKQMSKIGALKELRRLHLKRNKISEAAGFCSLPQLEELDLSFNALIKLTPGQGCQALRTLRLNDNQLSTLDGLAGLPRLSSLSLANNRLTSVGGLRDVPLVTSLDVRKQQLTKLDGLQGMTGLTSIYASHNQIASLEGFVPPPKLSTLDVSHNKLVTLAGLHTRKPLPTLDASHNQIADLKLPSTLYVGALKLDHNKLTSLEGLENYRLLKELSVKNNRIASLAPIRRTTMVEKLHVDHNALTTLATLSGREVGAEHDPAEKKMEAERLKKAAAATRRLVARMSPAARARYARDPAFRAIVDRLGQGASAPRAMFSLKTLTASHNALTSLAGVEHGRYLKTLDVSYNRLTNLAGIEQLGSLEELIVGHNSLTTIAGVRRCRLLKVVMASDNKLANKAEVFAGGVRPPWSFYDFRRNLFVATAGLALYRGVSATGGYALGGYRRSTYGGYGGLRSSGGRYGYSGGGGYRYGK